MPDYLLDLLSWAAFFVVFFFGLRWVQSRRKKPDNDALHGNKGDDGRN